MDNIDALVSEYYGIGSGESPNAALPELDLNSPAFNPSLFTQNSITEMPLAALVSLDNEIMSDIKALDSEQQMLVYENYNKFINATDMITQMKSKVDTMDSEIMTLQKHIVSLRHTYKDLEAETDPLRSRLQKLVHVRRVLQRLHFLIHLPKRLSAAIAADKLEEATKYYQTALPVLLASAHIRSFAQLHSDIEREAGDLRRRLRASAFDSKLADSKLVLQHAKLLLELGETCDHLWPDILESRRTFLLAQLQQMLVDLRSGFQHYFDDTCDEDAVLLAPFELFVGCFLDFAEPFASTFIQADSKSSGENQAVDALTSIAKELFTELLAVVRQLLLNLANQDHHKDGTARLCNELYRLYQSISDIHSYVPDAQLADRAADLIEICLRQCVESVFARGRVAATSVVRNLWLHLCSQHEQIESVAGEASFHQVPTHEVPRRAQMLLQAIFQQCLLGVAPLAGTRLPKASSRQQQYCSLLESLDLTIPVAEWASSQVDASVRSVCVSLRGRLVPEPHHVANAPSSAKTGRIFLVRDLPAAQEAWLSELESTPATPQMSLFHLICAQIAAQLAHDGLATIVRHLHAHFPMASLHAIGASELTECHSDCTMTQKLLLTEFVDVSAAPLIELVQSIPLHEATSTTIVNTADDGSTVSSIISPATVRPDIKRLVRMMKSIESELSGQFAVVDPVSSSLGGHNSSYAARRAKAVADRNKGLGFDKLFARRIEVSAPIELDAIAPLFAAWKFVLKALVEMIRQSCLPGTAAFQQAQADIRYLHDRLPVSFGTERQELEALLDEALASAHERCVAGADVPLKASILEQVIARV